MENFAAFLAYTDAEVGRFLDAIRALPDGDNTHLLPIRSERDRMVSSAEENAGNDFDYDLTNGRVPKETYRHGGKGLPRYASGAGYDAATRTGRIQLAPDSPDAAVGQPIPNFTPAFSGPAPDLGAHQRGAPPMRFGVKAALR